MSTLLPFLGILIFFNIKTSGQCSCNAAFSCFCLTLMMLKIIAIFFSLTSSLKFGSQIQNLGFLLLGIIKSHFFWLRLWFVLNTRTLVNINEFICSP